MTITNNPRTWLLTPAGLEATREKIAAVNARAARKQLAGTLTINATETQVERRGAMVTMHRVTISGDFPRYLDWEFTAALDWDPNAGLVVRTMPGAPTVDRDNLTKGACDHCGMNRRRRYAYLVRNTTTGQQMQVGRSCLRDFTGHLTSVSFAGDDDVTGFMNNIIEQQRSDAPTIEYIKYTLAVTELDGGWRASGTPGSTAAGVCEALFPPTPTPCHTDADRRARKENERQARRLAALADTMTQRAQAIIDYVRSDAWQADNDYTRNVASIVGADWATDRYVGILASVPRAVERQMETDQARQAREARAAQEPESAWVGTIGERVTLPVTVSMVRSFYGGQWGARYLVVMVADGGDLLKWWTGHVDYEVGDQMVITGTVKDHSTYQDTRETILTRCRSTDLHSQPVH